MDGATPKAAGLAQRPEESPELSTSTLDGRRQGPWVEPWDLLGRPGPHSPAPGGPALLELSSVFGCYPPSMRTAEAGCSRDRASELHVAVALAHLPQSREGQVGGSANPKQVAQVASKPGPARVRIARRPQLKGPGAPLGSQRRAGTVRDFPAPERVTPPGAGLHYDLTGYL